MSDQSKVVRNKLCMEDICTFDDGCRCLEAIDEALVPLRAENERLRAALKPFAYEYTILMQQQDGFPAWHSVQTKHLLEASRALAGEKKP